MILAKGAFGTPQILMLSGIGPEEGLKKHSITIVKNVPEIGKNLMDHVALGGLTFFMNEKFGKFASDDTFSPRKKYLAEYLSIPK